MVRFCNRFIFSIGAACFLLAAAFLFTGCKKEKTVEGNQVTGGWRDISTSTAHDSYYLFTADKKMYKLYYAYDGYKKVEYAIYKVTGSQIFTQGDGTYSSASFLYNMRFSGDTLFFNDGSADVIKLLKDNLAPKGITDWATPVPVQDRFVDTVRARTITFYNNHIYTFKYYTTGGAKFIEYNPTAHNVSAISGADFAYTGLDYVNGNLWCVYNDNAYIFSPGLGVHTYQSAVTTNGSYLWATAATNNALYNYTGGSYYDYNLVDNTWGHITDIDNDVSDLAYADGYLFSAKGGLIHRMHPYYRQPNRTWYLEGYKVKGIAHMEGTKFWLTAENNLTGEYELLRVTLE